MVYRNTPAPGSATVEIAGTYNAQFGNFAKDRGVFNLGWAGWGAEGLLSARYISGIGIPLTNLNYGTNLYGGYHLGSVVYFDLTAGYTYAPTRTTIRAGMLNVADKTPPIGGINSFHQGSSDSDVATYDTVGRRIFVGVTQKF
jgi:hypothetical protein